MVPTMVRWRPLKFPSNERRETQVTHHARSTKRLGSALEELGSWGSYL